MKTPARAIDFLRAAALISVSGLAVSSAHAQWQNKSNINIARARFGVTGAGVNLGQIELGTPLKTHEVFSNGAGGSRVTFENLTAAADANDDHATVVAGILAGNKPGRFVGAAPGADLHTADWTAPALTSLSDDYLAKMNWFIAAPQTNIINMSAEIRLDNPADSDAVKTRLANLRFEHQRIADYTAMRGLPSTLMVFAAGNSGRRGASTISGPNGAYNGITVGGTGNVARPGEPARTWDQIGAYSSQGPMPDVGWAGDGPRNKPDLVAPGTRIFSSSSANNTSYSSDNQGTSFAAPQVAGTAALMHEYGAANNLSRDARVMRACLMNSTNKTVKDAAGNRWDELMVSDGLGRGLNNISDVLGTGRLDANQALVQYSAGRYAPTFGNGANFGQEVGTTGFDLGRVAGVGEASMNAYRMDQQLRKGSYLTATLSWNRTVYVGGDGDASKPGNYLYEGLNDLDLAVSRLGSYEVPIQRSNSVRNSNEHMVYKVPSRDQYYVDVWQHTHNTDGAAAETYGLAWRSFAAPTRCGVFNGGFLPDQGAPVDNGWYSLAGATKVASPFVDSGAEIPDSAYALSLVAGDRIAQEMVAPTGYFDLSFNYAFSEEAGESFKVFMPVTSNGITQMINLLAYDDVDGDTIASDTANVWRDYSAHVDLTNPVFRGLGSMGFTELVFGDVVSHNAYVDNVFYVPTPGSVALLALGAVTVGRRTRLRQ